MSEAITLKKTLVAAAVTALAGSAWAAELGSLTVFSAVGEPLDAELTVRDVDPKAEQLVVRLAPTSTYRRVGKEVLVPLNDISLTLLRKQPYTIKIKGQKSVDAQKFPLIVELSESGKVSAKLYEIQLQNRPAAPMVKQGETNKSAPMIDASSSERVLVPSVSKASTSEVSQSSKVPSASAVPSAKPAAKKSAPEPSYVPEVREPVKQVSTTAEKKPNKPEIKATVRNAQSGTVKLPLNPADYDLDKPFLVRDGMTMWSIATLYRARYPQASMDQILVAFVRANPNAYDRGRVNGVKIGSRLTAPLVDEVAAVGLDEAWALVRVAPNTDARQQPGAKLLKRAQTRMQKEAPSLWRKWKADSAKVNSAKAKTVVAPVPEQKTSQPKPQPTVQPAAATEPPKDPLADTLAKAEAAHDAKVQTQEPAAAANEQKVEPEQTSASEDSAKAQTTPVDAAEQAATPVPEMPALQEKSEEDSGSFWTTLVGLLVILAAAGGAAWYWFKQRTASQRRREENMGVVKFRKAEAAKPEQLQATQEMLERRLESERATQRMKQAEISSQTQASHSVDSRVEPVLGDIKPQSQQSAGFNVAAAYVGDDSQEVQPERPVAEPGGAPVSPEASSGKLITARTYIGVGAYTEAQRVLHEVLLAGNEDQRRQASELLSQVEKASDGQQ